MSRLERIASDLVTILDQVADATRQLTGLAGVLRRQAQALRRQAAHPDQPACQQVATTMETAATYCEGAARHLSRAYRVGMAWSQAIANDSKYHSSTLMQQSQCIPKISTTSTSGHPLRNTAGIRNDTRNSSHWELRPTTTAETASTDGPQAPTASLPHDGYSPDNELEDDDEARLLDAAESVLSKVPASSLPGEDWTIRNIAVPTAHKSTVLQGPTHAYPVSLAIMSSVPFRSQLSSDARTLYCGRAGYRIELSSDIQSPRLAQVLSREVAYIIDHERRRHDDGDEPTPINISPERVPVYRAPLSADEALPSRRRPAGEQRFQAIPTTSYPSKCPRLDSDYPPQIDLSRWERGAIAEFNTLAMQLRTNELSENLNVFDARARVLMLMDRLGLNRHRPDVMERRMLAAPFLTSHGRAQLTIEMILQLATPTQQFTPVAASVSRQHNYIALKNAPGLATGLNISKEFLQPAMEDLAKDALLCPAVSLTRISGHTSGMQSTGEVNLLNGNSGAHVYWVRPSDSDPEQPSPAVLKVFPSFNEFCNELTVLGHLRRKKFASFRIPEPLGAYSIQLDGEWKGVLVSTAAPGRTLGNLMQEFGRKRDTPEALRPLPALLEATAACGMALAELHWADRGIAEPVPAGYIERRIARARNGIRIRGIRHGRALSRSLTRMREEIKTLPHGAMVHGDPHPGNFVYSPEHGVTIIDTPNLVYSISRRGAPNGPAELDVAKFLDRLEYWSYQEGIDEEWTLGLKVAFCQTYLSYGPPLNEDIIDLLEVTTRVSRGSTLSNIASKR